MCLKYGMLLPAIVFETNWVSTWKAYVSISVSSMTGLLKCFELCSKCSANNAWEAYVSICVSSVTDSFAYFKLCFKCVPVLCQQTGFHHERHMFWSVFHLSRGFCGRNCVSPWKAYVFTHVSAVSQLLLFATVSDTNWVSTWKAYVSNCVSALCQQYMKGICFHLCFINALNCVSNLFQLFRNKLGFNMKGICFDLCFICPWEFCTTKCVLAGKVYVFNHDSVVSELCEQQTCRGILPCTRDCTHNFKLTINLTTCYSLCLLLLSNFPPTIFSALTTSSLSVAKQKSLNHGKKKTSVRGNNNNLQYCNKYHQQDATNQSPFRKHNRQQTCEWW